MLSYNLTGSAVYVTIDADGRNLDSKSDMNCTCLECWLLDVAQQVKSKLDRITDEASERILDIWRLGNLMELKKFSDVITSIDQSTVSSDHSEHVKDAQKWITRFICHYMDAMASKYSEFDQNPSGVPCRGASDTNTAEEQSMLRKVSDLFYEVELPILKLNLEPKSDVQHLRFQQCHQQCRVLSRDSSLMSVISKVFDLANQNSLPLQNCVACGDREKCLQRALQEYRGLVVAKVLHGLGSTLVPANEWRDSSTHWESCRDLAFNSVKMCAMQEDAALI